MGGDLQIPGLGAAMALAAGVSIYAAAMVATSNLPEKFKWTFMLMPLVFIGATFSIEIFHNRNNLPKNRRFRRILLLGAIGFLIKPSLIVIWVIITLILVFP